MEKKTKIEMFTEIQKVLTDKEMIAFLEDQKELVRKKNSKKSLTPTQKANIDFKNIILNALTDEPVNISTLQSIEPQLADLSNQRVSALLTQLITENKVKRVIEKRKSFFAKA